MHRFIDACTYIHGLPVPLCRFNGDNTGLNAVQMVCTDSSTIEPYVAVDGSWTDLGAGYMCNPGGYITGKSLEREGAWCSSTCAGRLHASMIRAQSERQARHVTCTNYG